MREFLMCALILCKTCSSSEIRVHTQHYEPFMSEDPSGAFNAGIEFQLIKVIADRLGMELHFTKLTNNFAISNSTAADLILGGLFLGTTSVAGTNFTVSMPYVQDDLTWCVAKARKMPWIFALPQAISPTVWVMLYFVFGYVCGFLLYLLIQFDAKYEQRNNRDYHYITLLITTPAVLGISQRFRPHCCRIRLFYGSMLLSLAIGTQVAFVYLYQFLQIGFLQHQVATTGELVADGFALMGSAQVQRLIWDDHKYTNAQRHTFTICPAIDHCLKQLLQSGSIAVGASRHHILTTLNHSSSDIYCFDHRENIADNRISMLIDRELDRRSNVNELIKRIFEAGLLAKWQRDIRGAHLHRPVDNGSPYVGIDQLLAAVAFVLGTGWAVAILAFVAERIIESQLRKAGASRVWVYLEQFFDGKRHYFVNWPEQLLRSRGSESPWKRRWNASLWGAQQMRDYSH